MNTLNDWINENMNTQEELLTAILAELRKMNGEAVNPVTAAPQQESKRWMPTYGGEYGFIDHCGEWEADEWRNHQYDIHHYTTGNCYQLHEEERAIWEQVTRRKYETALWDAADWVEGDCYYGCWGKYSESIQALQANHLYTGYYLLPLPRFATKQSAIDAHTRILGDDAERYFRGRV